MSFLRPYLTYATANEAPFMFHVWGAYLCLAATVGRRVWFVADDGFIYPHLYVLYVGKAGNGKGEAMRKVKRVLAELGDISLSGNVETPEGFIRYICGNPNATPPIESPVLRRTIGPRGVVEETTPITIFATEFVNFIAMNPEGWINLLNDIWDADANYHYRTKGQGEDLVPGPSINIIGALTTGSAANLQKQQIIGTGLGRRTLFQFGERQWDNPFPRRNMTPERLSARTEAVEALKIIRKVTGLVTNEPEADDWWDEWYTENLRTTPARALNIQSWFASKPDIVVKLAMLTAVSEGRRVISISDYTVALHYLNLLEEDLPRIFGGTGRNELADVAMAIFDFVSVQKEPVSTRTVKTNFFAMCKPPTDFTDCIQFLCDSGKIKQATMTVGNVTDVVMALPEVMTRFAESYATSLLPSGGVPIVLPSDSVAATHPPSVPHEVPVAGQPASPTVAQSVVESLLGQLPKPGTKGD